MLKKTMIVTLLMTLTLTLSTSMLMRQMEKREVLSYRTSIEEITNEGKPEKYDIVVYGGGLQAVAAVAKAASNAPELSIALIVPYPVQELGGIATTGGQNYWDVRLYKGAVYQGGSFAWWYNKFSMGYNVQEFSDYLMESVAGYDNITTLYCSDIKQVKMSGTKIKRVRIGNVYRDKSGYIVWDDAQKDMLITGDIFIDASEDCKLLRLSDNELENDNSILTVGRYDWPIEYLTGSEMESQGVGIQASATLMFKVKGVEIGEYADMFFSENSVWGGNRTFANSSVIEEFNDRYGPEGYAIKSINASRDGEDSDEWWVNAFLIFNIDARAAQRDIVTQNYPNNMLPYAVNTDFAWVKGREFISEHADEIENVLHQFDGFKNSELVIGEDRKPVVGDILYLRESVHLTKNPSIIANGTENVNYAVTAYQSLHAGSAEEAGADEQNYDTRIGIGFYFTDIHPYEFTDKMPGINMRPDITGLDRFKVCPMYIPYESLVTVEIPNLIVAGYGSSISSVAWGELRVFGNLCVMGDAAGVAAAYCCTNNLEPANISVPDVNVIQDILLDNGAILDK